MSWHLISQSLRKHYPFLLFSAVIEKRDSQPLLRILDMIGGWPVAMDKWNETVGKSRPVWRHQGELPHNPTAAHKLTACSWEAPRGSFFPELT